MSEQDIQTLLSFFKTLANENRLKIIGLLTNQERSVEELSSLLNLKEPTVSHHMAKLKEIGLVRMYPDGNTHLYKLNSEALQRMSKDILTTKQLSVITQDINYDAWELKVLNTFLDGEQLKAIPVSRKKRQVILEWLVNKFEKGIKYSEKDVNEVIARYHPDYATLRREFIMNKMMDREGGGGAYWRVEE
ncbi:metalloregulator ArsR/SmtB family transcription factor [bacterium]|nr:metalloregulator ArsR/SmtB family transcription factor [bacterium]